MVRQDFSDDTKWLSLSEAARQLNVHPSTLRRWADEGQIPFMLTPGGHRRFATSDISNLTTRRQPIQRPGPVERLWAKQALEHTRRELSSHQEDRWLAQADANLRQSNRLLGQRLIELILKCLTSENEDDSFVSEARTVGHQYGENAKKAGLPLAETLRASMFFRDTLVMSAIRLQDNVRLTKESQKQMLTRMNTLLNSVQLGIAEVYESE